MDRRTCDYFTELTLFLCVLCTECPNNTFQCVSNGLCIPTCQLCDGYSQCGDNSDEINCGRDNSM